jgi:hypothetical protein
MAELPGTLHHGVEPAVCIVKHRVTAHRGEVELDGRAVPRLPPPVWR